MKRKLPLAFAAAIALPALAAVLPFTETFESGLGEFTVEDTNGDEVTIKSLSYYGYDGNGVQYVSSPENTADDWLFSPKFDLKKGYIYTVNYRYKVASSNTTHKVEFKLGADASSTDMTEEIQSSKEFTYNWGSWGKETFTFVAPETGEYHIGLHVLSASNQGAIYFDNIEVSEGLNPAAPTAPSVSEPIFSIVEDVLNTSFEITLPTLKNSGEPIDSDNEITVVVGRDDEERIGTVKGVPGDKVIFTDTEAPMSWVTYHFCCTLGEEVSLITDIDANPRFGDPKAVENFTVAQDGNEFTLSWDAVTEPTNASYLLIPSKVTYLVKCNGETIADNTSNLTATYTHPMPEQGQESVNFTIVAFASGKDSQIVTSDNFMVGDPYTGEFKESFAGKAFTNKTWVIENNKGWSLTTGSSYPTINPQDEDGGCISFNNSSAGEYHLWSPIIDLSKLVNPKLKFYAYLQPSSYYNPSIQAGFSINGEEVLLGEPIEMKSGDAEGWAEFIYDAPAEALAGNCQIVFVGHGGTYGTFYLDNISIMSYLDHNLAVNVTSPAKALEIGQEVTFPVTIENKGSNTESDYTLTLFADGEKVTEAVGPEVESMGKASAELSFKVLPKYAEKEIKFTVALTLEGDGDEEDNEAELSIPVNSNDLERVQTVNATLATDASKVTLEWTAPEVSTDPTYAEVTESFEDWDAGSMEGQNGWIFVDVDNEPEYGINNINYGKKYAAMIAENFNGGNYGTTLESYEGNKSLAVSQLSSSYNTDSDNWVISPEVRGGSDVTFYAISLCPNYTSSSDIFDIYYSEGGTEISDFVLLEETMVVTSSDWSEKSFSLPAKATRFAIRVYGRHSYPIVFDSFTFTAASTPAVHTGFNVYRDHELLATYPAETLSHVDEAPVMGSEHTYHVTALYDKGESHYSQPVLVTVNAGTQTGVTTISADMDDAEFFTLQGICIATPASGEIVIVRKGGKTFKAIVK